MIFTFKPRSAFIFALLASLIAPSHIHPEEPKSMVGPYVVAAIGLGCTIGSLMSGYSSYKNLKKWWQSSQEFTEVKSELTQMGATINEWVIFTNTTEFNAGTLEYRSVATPKIEVIPSNDFDATKNELFNAQSKKLVDLFQQKHKNSNASIDSLAVATGLAIVGVGALSIVGYELVYN